MKTNISVHAALLFSISASTAFAACSDSAGPKVDSATGQVIENASILWGTLNLVN